MSPARVYLGRKDVKSETKLTVFSWASMKGQELAAIDTITMHPKTPQKPELLCFCSSVYQSGSSFRRPISGSNHSNQFCWYSNLKETFRIYVRYKYGDGMMPNIHVPHLVDPYFCRFSNGCKTCQYHCKSLGAELDTLAETLVKTAKHEEKVQPDLVWNSKQADNLLNLSTA